MEQPSEAYQLDEYFLQWFNAHSKYGPHVIITRRRSTRPVTVSWADWFELYSRVALDTYPTDLEKQLSDEEVRLCERATAEILWNDL